MFSAYIYILVSIPNSNPRWINTSSRTEIRIYFKRLNLVHVFVGLEVLNDFVIEFLANNIFMRETTSLYTFQFETARIISIINRDKKIEYWFIIEKCGL